MTVPTDPVSVLAVLWILVVVGVVIDAILSIVSDRWYCWRNDIPYNPRRNRG